MISLFGIKGKKVDPQSPPPIPKHTYGINVTRGLYGLGADEARYIPYVCTQVGRLGRGEIGISEDGEVVFHLLPDQFDTQIQDGLHTVGEIWVVLRASDTLTV